MKKERIIIYGATDTGKRIYEDIKSSYDILCFVDDDEKRWNTSVDGIFVRNPDDIVGLQYDKIFVGVLTFYKQVRLKLKELGVTDDKIEGRYVEIPIYARIEFLKNVKELFENSHVIDGEIAELGVYKGEFAKEMNRIFQEKKLYLFDTFEGFSNLDCVKEMQHGYVDKNRTGYFSNTSEEAVLSKMLYPSQCRVFKGYFPKSAVGVEEKFCFVNLDVDLYEPTLAGLEFFWPRMVSGAIILIHDYFSKSFLGVKEAVKVFFAKEKIGYLPIGDTLSVAIRKI